MGKSKQTKTEFVLPPASLEQQAVIDALIKDQSNVICQAVAGAGKTTLILNLAKQMVAKQPEGKILNLTFNERLSTSNAQKIKDLGLKTNVVAKTFNAWENFPIKDDHKNGFKDIISINDLVLQWAKDHNNLDLLEAIRVKKQYNSNNKDSTFLKDYLSTLNQQIDQNQELKTYLRTHSFQWDYVCFDEAQDVDQILWYQILILVKTQTKAKFLILGDPHQTIYQFKGADQRFIKFADQLLKIPFERLKLSHSFRITKPIADFINGVAKWDDWIIKANPNKTISNPVCLYLLPPAVIAKNTTNQDHQLVFNKLWDIIIDLIDNQHYLPSEITFLSTFSIGETTNTKTNEDDPGRADFKILIDQFKQFIVKKAQQIINYQNGQRATLNVCEQKHKGNWHDLRFYSFHAYKGCENKVIIVLGNTFNELNYWTNRKEKTYDHSDRLQKPFYVAYTRALEQLHLVAFDVVKDVVKQQTIYLNNPILARWFNETALKQSGVKIDQSALEQWLKTTKLLSKAPKIYPTANDYYQSRHDVFDLKIEPAKISFVTYEDFQKLKFEPITIKNYQPLKTVDFIKGRLSDQQKDPIYIRDLISPAILMLIKEVSQNPQLTINEYLINQILAILSTHAIKGYNNIKTNQHYQQLSTYLAQSGNIKPVLKLFQQIRGFDLQTMKIETGFDLLNMIATDWKTSNSNYRVGPNFSWIDDPVISHNAPYLIKLLKAIKSLFSQHSYRQVKLKLNGFCDAISNQILIETKLNSKEEMNGFAQLILYNYFLTIENELIDLINLDLDDDWLNYLDEASRSGYAKKLPFKQLIFVGLDQGVVKKIINDQATLMELGLNLIIETLKTNTLLSDEQFLTTYGRQDLKA